MNRARAERTLLGLCLLHARRVPGARFDQRDIAAWCDCTQQAIYKLERSALRKIKRRLPREFRPRT